MKPVIGERPPHPTVTPVRVTHIVWNLAGGGLENMVSAMAERFFGGAVSMSVITLGRSIGRVGASIQPYVEQLHVAYQLRAVSMLFPLALARLIRETRPDVVHLHNASWYKGSLAARIAGINRVIYTEHRREHADPPFSRWLDRKASKRTDVVVAV